MAADTSTVTFTVLDVERVEGAGRLAALAAIEVVLDGVALTMQGLRVVRHHNRITTEAPRYRNPKTGQWRPALILPDELGMTIAREIHRILTMPAGIR
jgi:hypothetical protein